MLTKYLEWFKHHERLVLLVVVCIASLMAWHKWIAHADGLAHDQAVQAQEKLKLDSQQAQTAALQVAQLQQQIQQQALQNAALRQEVLSAISSRNTENTRRKAEETTAPLAEVATRWTQLVRVGASSVQADAGKFSVDEAAGRNTVLALEDGATAQANYQDLTKLDAGKDAQIAGLNTLVDSMDKSAKATQVVLQDQVTSCKATLDDEKKQAKKKQRGSFLHGLEIGAGVVAAIALKFL